MFTSSDHLMLTKESWENFTSQDHNTWSILFKRQTALLQNCAAKEFIEGINTLGMFENVIPKISYLNNILQNATGFSIVPVTGFIPAELFFKFLSERKFPTTCFIRKPEQLDYLEEPDIFHDVFGHIPLLINPIFANFMELFGHKGLEAIKLGLLEWASALYWFSVEFGLIKTDEGLKIYGAGILSSKGESLYSLKSDIPLRLQFDPIQTMKTKYSINEFQKTYYVINNFKELFEALELLDWKKIKEEI